MDAPSGTVPTSENVRVSSLLASVAVALNVRGCSSLTLCDPMGFSIGFTLDSLTVTVTVLESVAPVPSRTWNVMVCIPVWLAVGVQENTPVSWFIEAPVGGAPVIENVRVSAVPFMMSSSEAETVNVNATRWLALLEPMGFSVGSMFTSPTVTSIFSEAVAPAPSCTCMVMSCVPSCSSVGVQENSPADVMNAPSGTVSTSENARVLVMLPTKSSSVAEAVKVSVSSSSTVLESICASDGATLTSLTVTVIVLEALPPLPSATWTVTSCVPSCRSVGVQENAPSGVMDAPSGTVPTSENVRVLLTTFTESWLGSCATAVNSSSAPSSMDLSAMVSSSGARFPVTVTLYTRWLPVPKLPVDVMLTV